ncbi:MAG: ClpX C4-type zinc finger protein [Myxococcales bacterium]|nr:ClpX C4-type zinc finger protein [Myxococcales bacterium]
MSSEIRSLLAAAQEAEAHGDVPRAISRLQQAAGFYRARRMERRAAQMERHIDRLEGRSVSVPLDEIHDPGIALFDEDDDAVSHVLEDAPFGGEGDEPEDDGLGFGDELLDVARRTTRFRDDSLFDRGPQQADPAIDAWCSFCCKPRTEVGPLIAGPAGAFICASCVTTSAKLMALPTPELPKHQPRPPEPRAAKSELPSQRTAHSMLASRKPRVALVVGPEGSGKTVFLKSLGEPVDRPFQRAEGDTALVDLSTPLSADEEAALHRWLDAHPKRRAVLAARGDAPTPVLVLQGEQGDEPVYDTEALHRAVAAQLSPQLLSRVDSVVPLPAPDREALVHLGRSLLAAREIELPEAAIDALVSLAERSGRGARELAALIARIPAGRYKAP